ncbi:MAG: cytochrome ubiquinol oxidase subunit I [Spirochaetia bacterium]|nr:cytochrome ubiquinol oxidase subunit I [Spirochaetota bacterium]MCX8096896.1 cytochrome ubiquinol oxidase subunit I [Spirochaetota bacterium]MDW8112463.1 cytochrome ubiquinol oxidase subunit I [Spirochaetia bacterium]
MDPLILSRWQFAITAGFHFVFPSFTIGLSVLIFVFFLLYMLKKEDVYRRIGNFLVKIFAVGFAVGVATGIVMELQFGANWSNFAEKAGGVLGGPLAMEAIFAFFLESTFLSILVFGEKKISPLVRTISAFLVMIGTFISAFWILTVMTWMQIPTGYKIENGKILLTDLWAISFNTPNLIRFAHTVLACFIAGSGLVMGISAYHFLKGRLAQEYMKAFKVSAIVFLIFSILQIPMGTLSGEYVAEYQPLKLAMMEALWNTQKSAAEPIVSFIDQENMTNTLEIGIPGLLSLLAYRDINAEVKGIKDLMKEYNLKKEELPNIPLLFWSFRVMVFLGIMFIIIGIASVILYYTKILPNVKWFLYLLIAMIPLPIIANWAGWIVTEVGRQPWVIYGILKTKEAVSPLTGTEVGFTLFTFVGLYTILLILWAFITIKIARKGIQEEVISEISENKPL